MEETQMRKKNETLKMGLRKQDNPDTIKRSKA